MGLSIHAEISHLQTSLHRHHEEAMVDTAVDPSVMPRPVIGSILIWKWQVPRGGFARWAFVARSAHEALT
jgi:hypothetical protein